MLADVGEDQVVRDRRHLVEPRLAELPLDVVLLGEAEAAVRVEARVRRRPGRLRGEQLRHVRLRAARQALLEQPRRLVAHQVGRLDLRVGARDRELDALVRADRPPEDDALATRTRAAFSTNQRPSPMHSAAISMRSAFMPSRM